MLTSVCRIAAEAGQAILPFFQGNFSHHLKADRSPVTEADLASHDLLVAALKHLNPNWPVISEESGDPGVLINPRETNYWLVDPLDGTKEFMKGKPGFTVNIALMQGLQPVLGVVHAPALDLTYFAEVGQGAWRSQGRNDAAVIKTRNANLQALTVVASRDHSGPCVKRMLEKLPSPTLTSVGSSLKFCLIADGQADLYFRDVPTMEWDTAAAQCIVEVAGGQVLELNGKPLHYGKDDLKNPVFVAFGDAGFPWTQLASESENTKAFRSFFSQVCGP